MTTKLRAVARKPKSAAEPFSFVAPKRSLTGEPGRRVATCIGAEEKWRGDKHHLHLHFETEEGELGRMWVQLPPLKPTPTCRYMRLVTVARGGSAPEPGTPVHPENEFVGKRFMVNVGWRKSPRPGGGQKCDDRLSEQKKDARDFLRIHDLLEVIR